MQRQYDEIARIPADEYAAFTKLCSQSVPAWTKAKRTNDFSLFAPYLEKLIAARRAQARYFAPDRDPYEVLLDRYEKGLPIAQCDEFFATLRETIVPLLADIQTHGKAVRTDFLDQEWPIDAQRRVSKKIMELWGLDPAHCYLAESEHPFTTEFWRGDVRITTHYMSRDMFSNLYSVAHEGGHALYELNIDPAYDYTAVTGGATMGIHESQSRLFENYVGRSRAFVHCLYTLKTELFCDGKRIDGSSTNVGLRTLKFDANKGFALNGKWMKVKGVCLHHDAGVLGAVVPPEVWERRLRNLKEVGVNAIRMSHNPQAPVLYDLCDRMGFLVMDEASDEWEFPKRKWIKGWNVGEPSYDGTFDFFEEWIERDVTDMVRRDRNHPCIFLWSIGNEVDYPNDPYSHPVLDGTTINQPMFGGYKPDAPDAMRIGKIAKRLAACVRAVDTSRPVTGALAGVVMSNQTEYPEAVDVVGYNYTENRYDEDHATYPDRVIYGSETGVGIEAWHAVRDKEFIFGQFLWTGTDYLGESGRWPSRGLYTGLLDFGSFPKPRGYFRASLWSEKPVTYIGTYPKHDWVSMDAWDLWNYEPGQLIRVVCYTNAPQARLLLNGKEVGQMKPYDDKSGIIYWDIPYQDGELRAEGCDATGKVLSSYVIKTSGRPYALRATVDKEVLSPDKATAHVTIEVVDEQGTIVKLGDNDITCQIEGPARLLGLEGSNNSDMSDYTDNHHRAFHGRLLAYIQTTGEKGEIRVKLTSPLLKGTEVVLKAE